MVKSKVKENNYISIYGWMITDLGLKGNELLVYGIIYGFTQTGENNRYTGSLKYLAEWTNTTKQTVSSTLKSLVDKKYITKVEKYIDKIKVCEYYATDLEAYKKFDHEGMQEILSICKNFDGSMQNSLIEVLKNLDGSMQNSLIEVLKNLDGSMQESLINILIYILTNNTNNTSRGSNITSESIEGVSPPKDENKTISKSSFGEYQHVLLTNEEYNKLVNEHGIEFTNELITHLDEYIEMKGYKVKSHYLAINNWVIDAVNERRAKRNITNNKQGNNELYTLANGKTTNNPFLASLDQDEQTKV